MSNKLAKYTNTNAIEQRIANGITISLFIFLIPYMAYLTLKNQKTNIWEKFVSIFHIVYFPYMIITGTFYTIIITMMLLFWFGFFFGKAWRNNDNK